MHTATIYTAGSTASFDAFQILNPININVFPIKAELKALAIPTIK